MTNKELKEKTFKIVEKMEADGWDLMLLDSYTTTTRENIEGKEGWFAVLIKDEIHIYVELENENRTWLRDIKMHCPECGRRQDVDSISDCWDFCPECECAATYKKEINQQYNEYKSPRR